MELYLVRHAEALEAGPGLSDAQRPLSKEGREKMREASRGLRSFLGRSLDLVLTSPLVRAVETARLLALEVNDNQKVEECPPLAGDFEWPDLLPFLEGYGPEARVALVGHEPTLGKLAARLLSPAGGAEVPLKKGSIIGFELEAPLPDARATLLWFLTPRQLRLLAKGGG